MKAKKCGWHLGWAPFQRAIDGGHVRVLCLQARQTGAAQAPVERQAAPARGLGRHQQLQVAVPSTRVQQRMSTVTLLVTSCR